MNKIIKTSLLLSLIFAEGVSFAVAPAQVPATGETSGVAGSNKGVAWPSPRFVVGSGSTADCIIDQLTGLMWPKNGIIGFATYSGTLNPQPDYVNNEPSLNVLTWVQALTAVANMNSASIKLCGYSDWRLPNQIELKSLVNYGADPITWLDSQGFKHVQVTGTSGYWSSSTYAWNTSYAWLVHFSDGTPGASSKNASYSHYYILPVRSGM